MPRLPPQAYTDGLLDSAALHRVCIAAAADFRRVWARYGGRHAGRNLGKALKHLNTGVQRAGAGEQVWQGGVLIDANRPVRRSMPRSHAAQVGLPVTTARYQL